MKRITEATKIIGQNLRDLREIHGFSQSYVAMQIDKTFQQVQKYENGSNRLPSEILHQLKQFYGVQYDCFFKGLDAPAPHEHLKLEKLDEMLNILFENTDDALVKQKILDLIKTLILREL